MCKPNIDAHDELLKLSESKIETFFQKLKEEGIIKRKVKVWWFETNDSKTKIFVRLESHKRNPIQQVSKNLFLKTAGIKGMVLSDKGNKLEVVLSRDAKAVIKWMGLLIKHITTKNVEFTRVIQEFEVDEIADFLERLRNGEVDGMILLGIERKNAPIVNSPTIRLESSNLGSITDSLKELKDNHNLNLISEMKDILGMTVKVDGTIYRLVTPTNEEDKTVISFENRNMSEEKKDASISTLIKAVKK